MTTFSIKNRLYVQWIHLHDARGHSEEDILAFIFDVREAMSTFVIAAIKLITTLAFSGGGWSSSGS